MLESPVKYRSSQKLDNTTLHVSRTLFASDDHGGPAARQRRRSQVVRASGKAIQAKQPARDVEVAVRAGAQDGGPPAFVFGAHVVRRASLGFTKEK
jgi:hypothetical protein